MPIAPSPWLITDLTPEVIKALDGSIQTGAGRDGSRATGPTLPTAPAFTVSKTANSITAIITDANGATSYEASINGTAWVSGVTVSGLTPAAAYNFRLRGINAVGTGPSSAVSTVTTNAAVVSNNAWQAVLETNFFKADSFDDLADWAPWNADQYDFNTVPVKTNGEPSLWGRSSNDHYGCGIVNATGPAPLDTRVYFSGGGWLDTFRTFQENGNTYLIGDKSSSGMKPPVTGDTITAGTWSATVGHMPKWIGNDHPVYRDRGKSLCINYNNFQNGIDGFGPSRLGMYFGDLGNSASGLKKAHVFFMVLFDPEFFYQTPDGTLQELGVHKLYDICSGHTSANYWGSEAERATVSQNYQKLKEYGLNYSLIGTAGGGQTTASRIYLKETARHANWEGTQWGIITPYFSKAIDLRTSPKTPTSPDIDQFTQTGQWFGMEVAFDIGTLNTANGNTEVWLYDSSGNEVANYTGPTAEKLTQFDHKYNLMTLGGNRICGGYGLGEGCPVNAHSRIYFDDVIINPTRIGPAYFQLLTDFEGPL